MQERKDDVQKNNSSKHNRPDTTESNIQGRLDNTGNPEFKEEENRDDISQVDRQEGTMNHGELGGNFSDANE